jgi:hypothetical protein
LGFLPVQRLEVVAALALRLLPRVADVVELDQVRVRRGDGRVVLLVPDRRVVAAVERRTGRVGGGAVERLVDLADPPGFDTSVTQLRHLVGRRDQDRAGSVPVADVVALADQAGDRRTGGELE